MAMQTTRREQTVFMIHVGGKILFFWTIFLFLIEVVTFFGATSAGAKGLDVVAFALTAVMLGLSTLGVRWSIALINRVARPSKGSDPS
ncbi:MAG: hypothetical protein OWT27_06205 [Firmicutes bacterium]|nr:hypothetical protein [Bacillota bacterium]